MDVKTSHAKDAVALRTGREVEPLLRELYLVLGYSDQRIADDIGVHRVTVTKWRREYGIRRADRRDPLEAIA